MLKVPVYEVPIGNYEYNEKFNRYDSLKQYPIIAAAIPIGVGGDAAATIVSESDSAAICAEGGSTSICDAAAIVSGSDSAAICAGGDSAAIVAGDEGAPIKPIIEKTMSLVVSISSITRAPSKKDVKKNKQSTNNSFRKSSVDSNLLSFRYESLNNKNIVNYEYPYGYNMMYNPKYSKARDIHFNTDDFENERERYSTKFIINDKKSKHLGFILDITTKAILSVPLAPLLNKLNKTAIKLVDDHLKNNLYEIIKIEDGTIITLYSWMHPQNGLMWSMASNRGYDVSSFKWMGKMTYAEIFYDLVDRLYPEFKAHTGMEILYISLNGEVKTILTFSNLDPTKCYSLGFRHHNFHPLKIDPEKIWQVQYSDLSTKNEVVRVYSGGFFPPEILPVQKVWEYSKFTNIDAHTDEPKIVSYSMIEKKGESSFINACIECGKYIEKSNLFSDEDNEAPSTYIPQYGFILRSLDISQTGALSNIIIEYPLFINNKKLIYEQFNRDKLINETNRMKHNAMRAFLNDGRGDIFTSYKKKFIALYPEWSPKFYVFEQFISQLTIQIRLNIIYQQKKEYAAAPIEVLTMGDLKINREKFERIAIDFANMIKQNFKINKYTNIHNLEKIIRDYIQNYQYASIYLHILTL